MNMDIIQEIFHCRLSEGDLYNAGLPTLSFIYKKLNDESQRQSIAAKECLYSAYYVPDDRNEDKAALYSTANSAEAKAASIKATANDIGSIMNKKSVVTEFLTMESALYDPNNYPPILPLGIEAYEIYKGLQITDQCMTIDIKTDSKVAEYRLGRVISYVNIEQHNSQTTMKFFKILSGDKQIIAPMNWSTISVAFYDSIMRSSPEYQELYKRVLTQTTPGLKGAEIIF